MITTVIFDFGGVLIELMKPAELQAWLKSFGKDESDPFARMLLNLSGSDIFWQVMRGQICEAELWRRIAASWDLTEENASRLVQQITAPQTLNRALVDYAANLKGQFKLGILSNAGDATLEKLVGLYPFDRVFDVIVISAEVGFAKPDPEIYQIALDRLGSQAGETVFVDDLPENIAAGQAVGIHGVLHTENTQTILSLDHFLSGGRS